MAEIGEPVRETERPATAPSETPAPSVPKPVRQPVPA